MNKVMKVVAFMPIKLKNERCPGKNTRLLGDKPLLQYELGSLLKTNLCDEIFVYCSSEDVIKYLPVGVQFSKRSTTLDQPTTNFTQFTECFIAEHDADIYVLAHATAPFVSVATMKECINAVISGEYDSAFCAQRIQTFLWKDGKPLNFDASNLPRTQDLDPIYQETSGVYVFRKDVFTRLHRRIGKTPFIKELSLKEAIDIDEEKDFHVAQAMLNIEI